MPLIISSDTFCLSMISPSVLSAAARAVRGGPSQLIAGTPSLSVFTHSCHSGEFSLAGNESDVRNVGTSLARASRTPYDGSASPRVGPAVLTPLAGPRTIPAVRAPRISQDRSRHRRRRRRVDHSVAFRPWASRARRAQGAGEEAHVDDLLRAVQRVGRSIGVHRASDACFRIRSAAPRRR